MQTSTDTTNARFPFCIYDVVSAADVTLSVKFKAISGMIDQAAGLVWRYQNPANYYGALPSPTAQGTRQRKWDSSFGYQTRIGLRR